jgi:hypothetical protein
LAFGKIQRQIEPSLTQFKINYPGFGAYLLAYSQFTLQQIRQIKRAAMKNLILLFSIGLFACNFVPDKNKSVAEKSVSKDSLSLTEKQNFETQSQIQKEHCTRGKAKPVLKKSVYPEATFILQPDSLSGIETASFDNGDNLTIKNWGCEYYVLTFRFQTSRFQNDTTNLEYWFKTASKLVAEISNGIDAPIDISEGIAQLTNHIDSDQPTNFKNLKLGSEIDFGGNGIRNFVSVDRIEKLTDKNYAVDISFATGPL